MASLRACVLALSLACTGAHTALVSPVSRNAMDRSLPQFAGGKAPAVPCTCANGYEKEHPAMPAGSASGACWTDAGFNYNSFEHNLARVPGNSTSACCALCSALSNCSFFTLYQSNCYLKSAAAGRTPQTGAISGGTGARPPLPPTPDGRCDGGVRAEGGAGQPCLWWSQGCSIGCAACATNLTNGVPPPGPITGNAPHTDKAGFRKSYCDNPTTGPTLPRHAWTMNIDAVEGSDEDSYRFNPWRAPGSAPVVDPCGQAGGKYKQTQMGGDSIFSTTQFATMGDLGSEVLPKGAPAATWHAGSAVTVSWGIRYNHGGGYQYRLCPASEPLTEACFQKTPLEFDRDQQYLVWNNGTRWKNSAAVFVSGNVTTPRGSTWARNPIPRTNDDNKGLHDPVSCPGPNGRSGPGCTQFPAPCPTDTGIYNWSTDGSGQGACSGDWTAGVIEDTVLIPAGLAPGDYVLGWRQDCEETAQIWSNCADVRVVAP